MVVGVIVEFRPHAESELLHVRQVRLVMDVLQDGDIYILYISLDRISEQRSADVDFVRLSRSELSMHPRGAAED